MESTTLSSVQGCGHRRGSGIFFALGLVIAAGILGYAYDHAHPAELKTMTVTGSTERLVQSDTAKWSVTISKMVGVTSQADAGRKLDAGREVFLAYLAEAGITKDHVAIQPVSLSDVVTTVDFKTGQTALTGYSASQVLVIESDKVDEIGSLSQGAAVAMAEKDVTLSTQSLEYYFNKLADLKLELLTAATKNARARGEAILSGAGNGTLGEITSADTGVFQVTAVNSADLSDYGTYDTTSPSKKVTAVVHATFLLK